LLEPKEFDLFVQQGLGEMRLLLEQAEISMAKTNHKAASMEAELNSLRCQVLTLRYQLDAVDATDLTADVSQPQQVILSIVGGYQFECFRCCCCKCSGHCG